MANALPVPLPATFSSLFNNMSNDPFLENENYDSFLSPFDISPAHANATPESVRQLLAATGNQRLPMAIILLVNGVL